MQGYILDTTVGFDDVKSVGALGQGFAMWLACESHQDLFVWVGAFGVLVSRCRVLQVWNKDKHMDAS